MARKCALYILRFAWLIGLLGLAATLNSCRRTVASPPSGPPEAVMKAIHDYGSDHPGLLMPALSAKSPDETDEAYDAKIEQLIVKRDFAQLEKIAVQNRVEKGRVLGGFWKNSTFFSATSYPLVATDAAYQERMAILKQWVAAYPESAAARISLAEDYIAYANFGRGCAYANQVTDQQWRFYYERTAQAKAILLEAAQLKERDPHWYQVMQYVAHNDGWDKAHARQLLDDAIAYEPGYYHFYRSHAEYLLPKWYGEEGDIRAFAEEIATRLPSPDNSIAYFQIMSSFGCYCQDAVPELLHASYPQLRDGYFSLTKIYGSSNLTANRFAVMAFTFGDKPSAREAFAAVVQRDSNAWPTQESFDYARSWANTP
jgi:hypothetical protein